MATPNPVNVAHSGQTLQLWPGNGTSTISVLVYNPDVNNTVYVGYTNNLAVGGNNAIPLGPGQSVTIDGSSTIYGVAANGTAPTVVIPGGAAFFLGVTQGQGSLVLPSIHSPNYVPGISGWSVNKAGNVEFNSGTFRGTVTSGTFQGTDFIINSTGAFFYSATPALGNLVASIASAAGTDSLGNAYLPGSASYQASGGGYVASQLYNGALFLQQNTAYGGAYTIYGEINVGGGPSMQFAPGASSYFSFNAGVPLVAGSVVAWKAGLETWHPMSLLNSWTSGGRVVPQYRLIASPPNTTEIIGSLTAPAGIVAGQVIWNLPFGYTFINGQSIVGRNVSTNAPVMFSVVTGSPQTLQYQSGAASGNIIDFHAFISQDA